MNRDKMSSKATSGTAGLFVAAAALRLLLFTAFPGLPDLLTGRVEISTPVNSFKRCMYMTTRCAYAIRFHEYICLPKYDPANHSAPP